MSAPVPSAPFLATLPSPGLPLTLGGLRGSHCWKSHPSRASLTLTSAVIVIRREEECSPVLKEELPSLFVLHRCQIPVPNPGNHSQYTISVRPKEEEKFIKSSENSEFVPPAFGVSEPIACVTHIDSGPLMTGSSCLSLSTKCSPVSKKSKSHSNLFLKFSKSNNTTMTMANNMKEESTDNPQKHIFKTSSPRPHYHLHPSPWLISAFLSSSAAPLPTMPPGPPHQTFPFLP